MTLKFFWNGIKDDGGKLQRCVYSLGNLVPKFPVETITIYKRGGNGDGYHFTHGIRAAFTVENNTDMSTDYFNENYIRVLPNHPLYAEVREACEKADARGRERLYWRRRGL